jgi:integrase
VPFIPRLESLGFSGNYIKFVEYSEKYLKSKKYKKTVHRDSQYLTVIAEVWGNISLSQISKKDIEKLENALFERTKDKERKKKIKPSSVNRYFEILRHFFNMAIEDGYLKKNPAKFYIPYVEDGQRRSLTKDEISRILESAKFIEQNPRSPFQGIIYDLIVFALQTGMRLSEIVNLKKSYIRDDIIFYPVSQTKYKRRTRSQNKKVKVICLNSKAKSIVDKMKSDDDYVFPLRWRDPNVIRKTVKRIRDISGVEDFTFHQLRHTVSTIVSSAVSLAKAILKPP